LKGKGHLLQSFNEGVFFRVVVGDLQQKKITTNIKVAVRLKLLVKKMERKLNLACANLTQNIGR